MKTSIDGIDLYETKTGSPTSGGKRLVEVEHLPDAKVRVRILDELANGNCQFKRVSEETMFSEDFEQYILPLIH